MFRAILYLAMPVILLGCLGHCGPPVSDSKIRACGEVCGEHGIKAVSTSMCECHAPSPAPQHVYP